MRLRWVGDSRDYVKWDCVFEHAQGRFVFYVPMLRLVDPVCRNSDVQRHLDRRKSLHEFEGLFPRGFEVFEFSGRDYCTKLAGVYFEAAVNRISELQKERRILVFIDPDTGLEPPGGAKNEHLRRDDFRNVWMALHPQDKLVVYQHASHSRSWRQDLRDAASRELSLEDGCVPELYQNDDLAKDVCFLVLEKKA